MLGALETVCLIHFASEKNYNETSLKLSVLFYHPGPFRQSSWNGIYSITEENNKSFLPQIIKLLRNISMSKACAWNPVQVARPPISLAWRSNGHVGVNFSTSTVPSAAIEELSQMLQAYGHHGHLNIFNTSWHKHMILFEQHSCSTLVHQIQPRLKHLCSKHHNPHTSDFEKEPFTHVKYVVLPERWPGPTSEIFFCKLSYFALCKN